MNFNEDDQIRQKRHAQLWGKGTASTLRERIKYEHNLHSNVEIPAYVKVVGSFQFLSTIGGSCADVAIRVRQFSAFPNGRQASDHLGPGSLIIRENTRRTAAVVEESRCRVYTGADGDEKVVYH